MATIGSRDQIMINGHLNAFPNLHYSYTRKWPHLSDLRLTVAQSEASSAFMTGGVAFVLLDGIGDVNIPDLGRLTPLQAAETPTLDAIAGEIHALIST